MELIRLTMLIQDPAVDQEALDFSEFFINWVAESSWNNRGQSFFCIVYGY